MTGVRAALRERARVPYTDHLVDLVGCIEAHAARLRGSGAAERAALAEHARREHARLSVRLDASPLNDATADAVDRGDLVPDPPPPAEPAAAAGGWVQALKLDGMATQDIAALEYANALSAVDAEPALAERIFDEPLEVLGELHRLLCAGLVEPDRVGQPRRTDQAIHDGAQGQVLFALPAPDALPARLQALSDWLGAGSATLATPVLAGVLHETLLEWHPFEAAGGRLARAAARVLVRARGLDPDGAVMLERRPAADPLGYHRQVAATIRRRRDLTPWLEWWLEGVAEAVTEAADALLAHRPDVPARLREWLAAPGPARATVREYAEAVGVSLEAASGDLRAAWRAGLARPEAGSRGLRWTLSRG